jgi:hypothetical protein
MLKGCAATLVTLAAVSMPTPAAVLAVGYGFGDSPETARAAARDDLALRLQRRAEGRLEGARGMAAASVRRAIAGGRELPLIGVKLASVGPKRGVQRYEARLTDTSLTAYRSEAGRLAKRLRAFDPVRLPGPQRTAAGIAEWLALFDQHQRVSAAQVSLSPALDGLLDLDETKLWSVAVKTLAPTGGPKQVAQQVKRELDRAGIREVRVIAPVRADTLQVTSLAASIADQIRGANALAASHGPATHTLDGRYVSVGGRLLLTLFLLDASFNTRRAFVFVLPDAADRDSIARSAASELAETLGRGLVRVDMSAGRNASSPATTAASDGLDVSVRMGRGHRGLYYRPGDRDRLYVKLGVPGFYYLVGHVEKAGSRLSYLMDIGQPGAANRFVRRVEAQEVHRWLAVGEFTVAPPSGLEAVQVFATTVPPERMLPATRFDPVRNLHLLGDKPAAVAQRMRGLVKVDADDPRERPGPGAKEARFAAGEAVLQFSTLP